MHRAIPVITIEILEPLEFQPPSYLYLMCWGVG